MNTSFSASPVSGAAMLIAALEYPEVGFDLPGASAPLEDSIESAPEDSPVRLSLTEEELEARLRQAATEARGNTERELQQEFARRLDAEKLRLGEVITAFQQERSEYYARIEPELVNLILAVASKILHREARVDPMLLAALAKVAVENLQQRSNVVLRVAPESCAEWREFFAAHLPGTKVEVLEDSQLGSDGCLLETELGAADVGLDAQLKEIERGFFDLLAKRPDPR